VEEILFRGFLYSGLKKSLPKIWAVLLTCTIFAAPHLLEGGSSGLLWVAGIDTFILSLVLIWLREKTGRLYASMGLHALKNFIAFASLFLLHAH
jgi:membrane protease YdiL (CAAX protease family)